MHRHTARHCAYVRRHWKLDMTNPGWLDDSFAGVMMLVAIYSVGRLLASRAWSRPIHRDIDVAHVLMGTAMAGMLVTAINPLPSGIWELVFSALAAWFVWRCYQFVMDPGREIYYHEHVHRLSRRLIHLTMSLAMLYMYLAAVPSTSASSGSMAMGAASGTVANFALLPGGFIVALLVSAIWQLDAIGRFSRLPVRTDEAVSRKRVPEFASKVRSRDAVGDADVIQRADGHLGVASPPPPWLAPRLEAGSHIVMCFTMAYMLVLML